MDLQTATTHPYTTSDEMKNRYEALIVLNTKGREENANDIIERLEKEFQKEGAKVEQIQRMERRALAYVAGPLDSGYFVNFIFEAETAILEKLRVKLRLDPDVYRQHYQKLTAKKVEKE